MIVVMKRAATASQTDHLVRELKARSFQVHRSDGVNYTILAAIGEDSEPDLQFLASLEGVERIYKTSTPYKLAGRDFRPEGTVISIEGVRLGNSTPVLIASLAGAQGPERLESTIRTLAAQGICLVHLRMPPHEPTAMLDFADLPGVRSLADRHDVRLVADVADLIQLENVAPFAHLLRIPGSQMQNYPLLRAVGQVGKAVLLHRGMAATFDEFLLAAEHILTTGTQSVVLCSGGIRSFPDYAELILDVSLIPVVKERCHLPIIVDLIGTSAKPQHVEALVLAGIAAGADGLLVEVDTSNKRLKENESLCTESVRCLLERVHALSQSLHREKLHEISALE
jgi:3-deoxy-7-phosphoheptulonate synthase